MTVEVLQEVIATTGIELVVVDATDAGTPPEAKAAVSVDVEVDALIPLQRLRITLVESVPEGIFICV